MRSVDRRGGWLARVTVGPAVAAVLLLGAGTAAEAAPTAASVVVQASDDPTSPPTTPAKKDSVPQLSATGSPAEVLLPVGLLSVGLGAVMLLVARRMNRRPDPN